MPQVISDFFGTPERLNVLICCVVILLAVAIGLAIYVKYLRREPKDIWRHKQSEFMYACKYSVSKITKLLVDIVMLSADKDVGSKMGGVLQRVDDLTNDLLYKIPEIIIQIKADGQMPITEEEYNELLSDVKRAVEIVSESEKAGDLYDFYSLAIHINESEKKLNKIINFLQDRLAELKSKE